MKIWSPLSENCQERGILMARSSNCWTDWTTCVCTNTHGVYDVGNRVLTNEWKGDIIMADKHISSDLSQRQSEKLGLNLHYVREPQVTALLSVPCPLDPTNVPFITPPPLCTYLLFGKPHSYKQPILRTSTCLALPSQDVTSERHRVWFETERCMTWRHPIQPWKVYSKYFKIWSTRVLSTHTK